jgi:hypothetical protein
MQDSKKIFDLTSRDLAELFGTTEEDIELYCEDQIAGTDFCYRKLENEERDQLILKVLKHIYSEDVAAAGRERRNDWEKGWNENLQEFIDSGYNVDKLVPKYFKKNVPVRLNRDYVIPINQDFVLNVTNVFRNWLFQKYLQEAEIIYEFGCGPAVHLAYLATLYPGKRLFGFDWAKPSQEIIRLLAERYGWSIQGDWFDFFHIDETLKIESNSAVFTFGALEQIGKDHNSFLNFLLKNSPDLCINIEGLHELYDQEYLSDYLAIKYHKKRNYLDGYLTQLKKLESDGKLEIIKIHHQQFGNLFDDPHSYVIWKPKK